MLTEIEPSIQDLIYKHQPQRSQHVKDFRTVFYVFVISMIMIYLLQHTCFSMYVEMLILWAVD